MILIKLETMISNFVTGEMTDVRVQRFHPNKRFSLKDVNISPRCLTLKVISQEQQKQQRKNPLVLNTLSCEGLQ